MSKTNENNGSTGSVSDTSDLTDKPHKSGYSIGSFEEVSSGEYGKKKASPKVKNLIYEAVVNNDCAKFEEIVRKLGGKNGVEKDYDSGSEDASGTNSVNSLKLRPREIALYLDSGYEHEGRIVKLSEIAARVMSIYLKRAGATMDIGRGDAPALTNEHTDPEMIAAIARGKLKAQEAIKDDKMVEAVASAYESKSTEHRRVNTKISSDIGPEYLGAPIIGPAERDILHEDLKAPHKAPEARGATSVKEEDKYTGKS